MRQIARRAMSYSIILALCTLSVAAPAWAGSFEASRVPATAQVVVHIDLDAVRGSQLRALFDKEVNEAMNEVASDLKKEGIPLAVSDLSAATGITFWAEGDKNERGALIVSGLDARRVANALAKVKGYQRTSSGGHTLHGFKDDDSVIGIHGGHVVAADDKDSVTTTLDVLAGRGKSLARSGKARRIGQSRGVLFAAVFEQKIAQKIKQEAQSAIFKDINFQNGIVVARETRSDLVLTAEIETSDVAGANQLHKLAAGAIAFLEVAADDPDVAKLLDGVKITSNGTRVTFTLTLPFKSLKTLVPALKSKI